MIPRVTHTHTPMPFRYSHPRFRPFAEKNGPLKRVRVLPRIRALARPVSRAREVCARHAQDCNGDGLLDQAVSRSGRARSDGSWDRGPVVFFLGVRDHGYWNQ